MLKAVVKTNLISIPQGKITIKAELVNVIKARITGVSLGASYPIYKGPFVITPTLANIELPTEKTLVKEPITILPIPVKRVRNDFGGTSVYIGGINNG